MCTVVQSADLYSVVGCSFVLTVDGVQLYSRTFVLLPQHSWSAVQLYRLGRAAVGQQYCVILDRNKTCAA